MKIRNFNTRSAIVAASVSVILMCSDSTLYAEEQEPFYTLTAIEDASYGEDIVAGDHDKAIKGILSLATTHRSGFEAQTNLCVAYTRSGDFKNAKPSCDAALAALKGRFRPSNTSQSAPFYARRTQEKYLALALSNRGVLRALSGKPDLARKDFEQAAELRFGLDVVDVNLAKLGAEEEPNATPESGLQDW